MTKKRNQAGFTLMEVMAVMIILAVIAAIAIPRLSSSTDQAREQADISTGRQVKDALERYQVEHGTYPKSGELISQNGTVSDEKKVFIGQYISKLDPSVTQQRVAAAATDGFGVEPLPGSSGPSHLIMIYLTTGGEKAEVRVYDGNLSGPLWSSNDY